MTLGVARPAPPALRGFDTDEVVDSAAAKALFAAGYRLAIRYVRRTTRRDTDLRLAELRRLLAVGFGVMPVQHVESSISWTPSVDKGRLYGDGAAAAAMELEFPQGTTVWLDLEGVAAGVPPAPIISYCNYWFDRVSQAGFQPGLYIGWHARLTGDELFHRLKCTRYWAAYNLNLDQYPAVRGVCLRQGSTVSPVGVGFQIDSDLVVRDALGDLPTVCAPDSWGDKL